LEKPRFDPYSYSILLGTKNSGDSIRDRILGCLDKVEAKLAAHERAHG